MTFALRLNGEIIAEIPEQVTGVRLLSSRGQAAAMGISPDDGVIDIVIDTVAPGGPPRLDQLEALAVQQLRDRAEEGVVVGTPPDSMRSVGMGDVRASQGLHLETVRPGGVDVDEQNSVIYTHPVKDIFAGLDLGDTETRTARANAFAKTGNVDSVIKDYPPGSGVKTQTEVRDEPKANLDLGNKTPVTTKK